MESLRPALLVLDLINDVAHPDGKFAGHGYAKEVARRGVLDRTAAALHRARATGIPVIYVVVGFSPTYVECPADSPIFGDAPRQRKLTLGEWGTRIHDAVKPQDGEPLVVKHRISPFYGTSLDLLLRNQRVDTLLLTGVSTDLVVLSTAREGHDRDFRIRVLADATAATNEELHESALRLLARTAEVTTVQRGIPAR
ncbi:isochorismatase family cysteine hydrolase [Actinomadura rubrisoli]|uniref:Cysteine hydrolase n=1 Tax=Actinomadura rubrisoli TaxID=2530368 RepID=A0A4R5BG32_9ACTN|nr:isochorismatase family cysteine hydrolase [Actinomadura rubrisoli]TDD83850.1 cysteine hydrolase [Actinomadura rubrisoli]